MKSIAIVTDFKQNHIVSDTIMENLKYVFKDYVKINNYYIEEFKDGEKIKDHVVLVMLENRLVKVKPYVDDLQKIIIVQRTIRGREAYKLFEIPKETKILVVNDCQETTLQMVALLYQIGVKHVNMIPYNPNENDESIKISITPGEVHRVPSYIENIIDVGHRCLDSYTFIRIMNMLDINNREISTNLIKYFNEILDLNTGIKNQYKDVYIKNEQLNKVMQQSNEGILIVDNDYHIVYRNMKFQELLDIDSTKHNDNLEKLLDADTFKFLMKEKLNQELLNMNNEFILVTKASLEYFGERSGYYFNFRSITYIKQLEQNMSSQLRKKGLVARYSFDNIIYKSYKMKKCIEIAKKISNSDFTVLIIGESGTGKELMAQSIHNYSKRAARPFVAINCAALPESLLESELFGYERGAFTGARKDGKLGVFELAQYGTIFLDEIGDMPLALQARLLRVLQEKQIMRIGSDRVIDIDVRIIAATNKNLKELVRESKFREDLYYRINVLPVSIPPLRERKEDIIDMFKLFVGEDYKYLTKDMKKRLLDYEWPGNVRELKNAAEYFIIMKEMNEGVLPFSLEYENDDLQKDVEILLDYGSEKEIYTLLDILNNYTRNETGIGRKKLLEKLRCDNVDIGENRLRRILSLLKDKEFVKSDIGRKGTKITGRGIKLKNRLINRM
ncbi:sigma-54 interaction domain-containing protein [Oceanirhabdus seepicola]|uniref:Sigma 54-interacting transcriptional regulator n=1 Tax=Oceanirhabdus seepicola TaxID=2828781 RepID=A0A9J6NZJ3_9CLOT|nr:sigma 54-interacting transcriptional regulator [Oceanirhabdus seepicola]MCM1989967.1 sigma 54-interacting transcriptional regulator [Oceanirhabdus seepicola]